jgi:hypothetical protein
MLNGDKVLAQAAEASRDDVRSRLLALVVVVLSAGAVALLLSVGAT